MASGDGVFSVATATMDGVPVIRLVGEIDMSNAEAMRAEVMRGVASAQAGLVVDLTEVTFLASSGLSALVRAQTEAERHGVVLAVAAHSRAVLRPLEATGVDALLLIHATTADAVAALRTGSTT